MGIKVQLLGQIELASERGQPHEFVSLGEWLRGGAWGRLLGRCRGGSGEGMRD